MAQPTTARPGSFIIELESADSPGVYAAPCGFTSKAFRWTRNLDEVTIPDCDDPDAPFWISRDVQSLSASVNGEGVLAAEAIPTWMGVLDTIDSVNARIEITYTTGVLLVSGAMQLESLEVGAQQGQRVSINVSLQSDGEMTTSWTPS